LYFNAQIGGIYLTNSYAKEVVFAATAHIGYQLVTRKGFLFTPAIGFNFDSSSGIAPHFMLDIGGAIRNKKKFASKF